MTAQVKFAFEAARHDFVRKRLALGEGIRLEARSDGLLELEDIETGESMVIDTRSLRIRTGYRDSGRTAAETRRGLFRRIDIDQIAVDTDRPYLESILRFFKMRERRLR